MWGQLMESDSPWEHKSIISIENMVRQGNWFQDSLLLFLSNCMCVHTHTGMYVHVCLFLFRYANFELQCAEETLRLLIMDIIDLKMGALFQVGLRPGNIRHILTAESAYLSKPSFAETLCSQMTMENPVLSIENQRLVPPWHLSAGHPTLFTFP